VHQAFDDLQIFVFPAANSIAQENLGESVDNPVEGEKAFESFGGAGESQGRDTNSLTSKYQLRSLPGKLTGSELSIERFNLCLQVLNPSQKSKG
jgi:hypothetical protein